MLECGSPWCDAFESTSANDGSRGSSFASWGGARVRSYDDIEWSPCRDLVVVPGGPDWIMRELGDKFPDYCWKFSGTGSIAQYYFDLTPKADASARVPNTAPSRLATPSLPVFHATLPHFYSPTDFSVQPKYLEKCFRRVSEELDAVYNYTEQPSFEISQLVPGVACAVYDGSHWLRGALKNLAGSAHALITFVDIGVAKLVSVGDLRWLCKRFGKVPPMALPCRIKDVYINDLDAEKVEKFQNLIEECGRIVRVELASLEEPYPVNIYHPTVLGVNLGKMFYRRDDDPQREAAKQRHWEGHVRRVNCENDSDFEQDDDDAFSDEGDCAAPPALYIRSLARSPKIQRAVHGLLYSGHVENSGCLALHDEYQLRTRDDIGVRLAKEFPTLPALPSAWLVPLTACVVTLEDGRVCRASIETVVPEFVEIITSDFGDWARVPSNEVAARLRVLPPAYDMEPLLYLTSLDEYGAFPHPSISDGLKELLLEHKKVRFVPESRNKRIPCRGRLLTESGAESIHEIMLNRLSAQRVDPSCRAAAIPSSSTFQQRFSHLIRLNFIHRTQPPTSLVKGNLELTELSHY